MSSFLETEYNVQFPVLTACRSLSEGCREAQLRTKFLVIYLHCSTHENTDAFVADVLGDRRVMDFVAARCVVLAVDVTQQDPLGDKLAIDLGATTFPFVAVFAKQQFLGDIRGSISSGLFLSFLSSICSLGEPIIAKEAVFVHDRDERQAARAMQQAELDAARQTDMTRKQTVENERKKKQAAISAAQQQQDDESRRIAELDAAKKKLQEQREVDQHNLLEQKALLLSSVPQEPQGSVNKDEVVTIKLMSLCGKAHERRFWRVNTLSDLYLFASSLEVHDGRPFSLVSGFPPTRLENTASIIGATKALVPRAVVMMRLDGQ